MIFSHFPGNYPHWIYSAGDLVHEGALTSGSLPLRPGDRVSLAANFSENGGDGWCLGDVGSGKVGVVRYAPLTPKGATGEQRGVLVASEDEPDRLCSSGVVAGAGPQ